MTKHHLTRRKLLAAAAPLAAAPIVARYALDGPQAEAATGHGNHGRHAAMGHAAMIGPGHPPSEGRTTSMRCSTRQPALPYSPGRVREYTLTATDREIEVAPGVFFPAWTYNGTVPGPVLRATEGDILRVTFVNAGSHPHTIHFHGIHPTNMDGVFEAGTPGGRFTYEFEAKPYGMQLYHCHATPLKKHIHKGLYGALIIDPKEPRRRRRSS